MNARKKLVEAALALAGAAALTGASVGTASAAPSGQLTFHQQTKAAGLSDAQASALQAEVNRDLAVMGGTQVAPNRIDLNGKGTVFVAVPGETHPRDLSSASGIRPAYDPCAGWPDYGHMCAYSGTNHTGSEIDMYSCDVYYIPWYTTGSWDNNQTRDLTGGRIAAFYWGSRYLSNTGPARSLDENGNWSVVSRVYNCWGWG
ncbi:hypothetical protein [Streptomyces sp. NPDC091215]|uniref:hypothetical protein n=1 Tax=Streptomyces sp. NPDC091215 TaxID=3155192 RepID=UPI00341CD956